MDEQGDAGWLMVKLAVLLFAGWLATLFVGGEPAPTGRECIPLATREDSP